MSEGSVDEEDHAEEQRENALIAEHGEGTRGHARRHTQQMQIEQERISDAEKLERKSCSAARTAAHPPRVFHRLPRRLHAAGGAVVSDGRGWERERRRDPRRGSGMTAHVSPSHVQGPAGAG